jgi:hypothetical protein
MTYRRTFEALVLAAFLTATVSAAHAEQYPDWRGEWAAVFPRMPGQQLRFDPSKPYGEGQQAPLTDEYKKIYADNLAEVAAGKQGLFLYHASCYPAGMPTMMSAGTHEFVITPDTTYILGGDDMRRVFTDGRPWPKDLEPTYQGFSIGRWVDEGNTGTYNVLEVETRGPFKGPRAYDASGLPLAFDNESTFQERFHLDRNNPNILHDEMTVFDHALTRPWSVDKTIRRSANPRPTWLESNCVAGNINILIGKENYWLSADGLLMPARKDQPPPDLRYFNKAATAK